jgi:CarD family transcriptional regulator
MYKVNDKIVYGTHGVCEVTDIGRLSMSVADRKKKYYTLRPVYQKESLIYVPVDSEKIPMRLILTREEVEELLQEIPAAVSLEEVEELLQEIPQLDTIWVSNEKEREYLYKQVILKGDCRELVRIIKTIYFRMQSRLEDGKKVAAVDERYFRQAEDLLYGELAYVLDMKKEEMNKFIGEYMQQKAAD